MHDDRGSGRAHPSYFVLYDMMESAPAGPDGDGGSEGGMPSGAHGPHSGGNSSPTCWHASASLLPMLSITHWMRPPQEAEESGPTAGVASTASVPRPTSERRPPGGGASPQTSTPEKGPAPTSSVVAPPPPRAPPPSRLAHEISRAL